MTAAAPAQTALEQLIAYIRRSYLPHSPTVALLRAYDAQIAENARLRALLEEFSAAAMIRTAEPTAATEVARLRAEVAALRQCLALANVEPTEIPPWRHGQVGEHTACAVCETEIMFDGERWTHVGACQPRHIAWPKTEEEAH
jgi:hypothetical protein